MTTCRERYDRFSNKELKQFLDLASEPLKQQLAISLTALKVSKPIKQFLFGIYQATSNETKQYHGGRDAFIDSIVTAVNNGFPIEEIINDASSGSILQAAKKLASSGKIGKNTQKSAREYLIKYKNDLDNLDNEFIREAQRIAIDMFKKYENYQKEWEFVSSYDGYIKKIEAQKEKIDVSKTENGLWKVYQMEYPNGSSNSFLLNYFPNGASIKANLEKELNTTIREFETFKKENQAFLSRFVAINQSVDPRTGELRLLDGIDILDAIIARLPGSNKTAIQDEFSKRLDSALNKMKNNHLSGSYDAKADARKIVSSSVSKGDHKPDNTNTSDHTSIRSACSSFESDNQRSGPRRKNS